jgi:hypothetical protein
LDRLILAVDMQMPPLAPRVLEMTGKFATDFPVTLSCSYGLSPPIQPGVSDARFLKSLLQIFVVLLDLLHFMPEKLQFAAARIATEKDLDSRRAV